MENTQKKPRRYFTKARKLEILRELEESAVSLSVLSRKYDIHPVTIYSWKRTFLMDSKHSETDTAELLKENERLKQEVSALKDTVTDLAVSKKILECSNKLLKRDQLKKKSLMEKKFWKSSSKKK